MMFLARERNITGACAGGGWEERRIGGRVLSPGAGEGVLLVPGEERRVEVPRRCGQR